jgi:hypothetical protein
MSQSYHTPLAHAHQGTTSISFTGLHVAKYLERKFYLYLYRKNYAVAALSALNSHITFSREII